MTSTDGQYVTQASDGDGLPLPSEQDQELILDAWREALGQALHIRDTEWKEKVRVMAAEATAVIAELRAAAAEFRSTLEAMTSERLAQIRPMDGPRGERGQKGDKGDPGELPIVRAWSEDDISYAGDVVTCDGGTWQARKDTSKKPPHRDWVPLAVAGRNAASPLVRGTFDPVQNYSALNIVAMNGSAFIARCDDPGECPGDGWQLIASAGRAGKPGPKGESGEPGPRGERGLPGQAGLTILSWQVDPERYRAMPLMSDGSEGAALELRPLFEQYHTESSGD
jgi:hypothetical protein